MPRFIRWIIRVTALAVPIFALWAYRASVVGSASEYQPRSVQASFLPEGTEIDVVLPTGIPRGTSPGDIISGVSSSPVRIQDHTIIPEGVVLKARVEKIVVEKKKARVRLRFHSLILMGRQFEIQTEPVETVASIQKDYLMLGQAFESAIRAVIASRVGAASQSVDVTAKTMALAASQSVPALDHTAPQIRVRLSRPLWLR